MGRGGERKKGRGGNGRWGRGGGRWKVGNRGWIRGGGGNGLVVEIGRGREFKWKRKRCVECVKEFGVKE